MTSYVTSLKRDMTQFHYRKAAEKIHTEIKIVNVNSYWNKNVILGFQDYKCSVLACCHEPRLIISSSAEDVTALERDTLSHVTQ